MVWVTSFWVVVVLISCRVAGSQRVTQVHFQSDGIGSTESMLDVAPGTIPDMTQLTVCARLFLKQAAEEITPLTSYYATMDNELLLGTLFASQTFSVLCCQDHISFDVSVPVKLQTWQHTCIALNLETRKYWIVYDDIFEEGNLEVATSEPLKVTGKGRWVIGQELDSLEGGMAIQQSIYGTMAQYQLFSKALDPSFMENYVRCLDSPLNLKPVLSFNDMSVFSIKGSTVIDDIPFSKLCQKKPANYIYLLPEKRTFFESHTSCLRMGGSLTVPTNAEENISIGNEAMKFHDKCLSYFQTIYWLGVRGDLTTRKWHLLTDGKELSWKNLQTNKYGTVMNHSTCLTLKDKNFGYIWVSTSCDHLTCPSCNISSDNTLIVRGLCKNTYLDRSMTINGYYNGKPIFYGVYYTKISWSNKVPGWIMTNRYHTNLTGIMYMETPSAYPFGVKTWNISGDKCAINQVKVMITACNPNTEITCNDGTCISKSLRCNMNTDCSDQSDELDCNLIEAPSSYATDLPPPNSGDTSLPINLSIDITSVRHIDILAFKIGLDIRTEHSWRDNRLHMKNLKDDKWSNKVQDHTILWKPRMQVTDGSKSLADVKLRLESLMILKEGKQLPDDPSRLIEDLYYSGSDNTLLLYQVLTIDFTCQFKLQRYPFDTQTCSLLFSLLDVPAEFAALTQDGDGVVFTGEKELLEYVVTKVNMNFVNTSDSKGGQMVMIELKNLYGYYISSTYIPTALLVIICYLTLFFDIGDFTDRVMVSLTSLLVLAALFSQTSQTIPKTAYLKLIDIWFVSIIIIVFHFILLLVIIESLRLKKQCFQMNSIVKVGMIRPAKGNETFQDFSSSRIPQYKDPNCVNYGALFILPIIMVLFLIAYVSIILAKMDEM